MSIYTAARTVGSAPQTLEFSQRDIKDLTQSKLSSLIIFGKANHPQLAYDGYVKNIDVFLSATAQKKRLATYGSYAPLLGHIPTVPIPLPKIIFTLRIKLNEDQVGRFLAAGEEMGMKSVKLGRNNTAYTIDSPRVNFIKTKIIRIANMTCQTLKGYCTLEAFMASLVLYQITDLFLSVNSYPYSRGLEGAEDTENERIRHYDVVADYDTVKPVSKKRRVDVQGDSLGDIDDDMTPLPEGPSDDEDSIAFPAHGSEVLFAKPSPLPSSINFGTPRDVPNLPGLLFPYFDGMVSADVQYIRSTVALLFFRNLPSEDKDPHGAYRAFRSEINTFAYTTAGTLFTHILKGMELALQTQTQLFLLFGRGTYLGFCLLGGLYSVWNVNQWNNPMSPHDLQEQLKTIWTHDDVLVKLGMLVKGMKLTDGRILDVVNKEALDCPLKIANMLGHLKIEGDEGEAFEEKVSTLLKMLSFPTDYKVFTKEHLTWFLEMMTIKKNEPIPSDINLHFPSSQYSLFGNRAFILLCSFGPRGPSWIASSGTSYNVPAIDGPDPLSRIDEKTKMKVMPYVIVTPKPNHVAYSDWELLCRRVQVRFDIAERARESRCVVFQKGGRDIMWDVLKKTVGTLKAASEEGRILKKRKVGNATVVDVVEFDDLF